MTTHNKFRGKTLYTVETQIETDYKKTEFSLKISPVKDINGVM